jgi:hypothetical protein
MLALRFGIFLPCQAFNMAFLLDYLLYSFTNGLPAGLSFLLTYPLLPASLSCWLILHVGLNLAFFQAYLFLVGLKYGLPAGLSFIRTFHSCWTLQAQLPFAFWLVYSSRLPFNMAFLLAFINLTNGSPAGLSCRAIILVDLNLAFSSVSILYSQLAFSC